MAEENLIFSRNDFQLFWFELKSKFRGGVRSPDALLYVMLTPMGIGWASFAIPAINRTHFSPETLGIYVIGFLVTLLLDALLIWKKSGPENGYEWAIAVLSIIAAVALIMVVSYFSVSAGYPNSPGADSVWRDGAYPVLWLSFLASVLMTLVISGFDAGAPPVGPLDTPVEAVEDRNG